MELELRQEYINCWDNGYHSLIHQEETTEMIVPDACPDILQILDGEGKLLLQRREATDGKAELSGCIKVGILYQPDGDGCLCSMEGILPFSANPESPTFSRSSKLLVYPQIQKVDVHVLNPRKVLIKVNFSLDVRSYTPQNLCICSGAEQGVEEGICQKIEEFQSHLVLAAQEKSFHYSDSLNLPAGSANIAELLRFRTDCLSQEAKVIGNKLLFKGEVRVELLYLSPDGHPCTSVFPLPFSQMMEIGEAGEDCSSELRILFTDAVCKREEDGRTVSIELELMAQCVLRRSEHISLLTDLYSTLYEATEGHKQYPLSRLMDQGTTVETVRETLDCGMPMESVVEVQLRPLQWSSSKQGNEMSFEADLEAFVLFHTEGGMISSTHRRILVTRSIPISPQWEYSLDGCIGKPISAQPSAGGVDLSFPVEFNWKAMEKSSALGIERVTLEEKQPTSGERPSVVIRSVRSGECLWDIAKSYRTCEHDITEANALPTNELYSGQMLLIPR